MAAVSQANKCDLVTADEKWNMANANPTVCQTVKILKNNIG